MFKFYLVFLVWTVFLSLPIIVNTQKIIEIHGFVVDEENNPVRGAKIFWTYEPKEPSSDSPITVIHSLEDGYFGFATEWRKEKSIRVFIEVRSPSKCFEPVDVTDQNLRYLPQFQGILITEYKPDISLGKVKEYIQSGNVSINLQNIPDSFIQKIKNRLIYLRIKDKIGNVVSDKTVNAAYSENSHRLEFCLPEGEWYLELYENETKTINIQPNRIIISSQSPVINVDIVK